MRYIFTQLTKAEKIGIEKNRIAANYGHTENLFGLQKEERYEGAGQVAYIDGADCFISVIINLEDATIPDML